MQSDEFTQMNFKGFRSCSAETMYVLSALVQLQGGRTSTAARAAKNSVVERRPNGGQGALALPDMAPSKPLPVMTPKRSCSSMDAPPQDHQSPLALVLNSGSCPERHTPKSPPTSPVTGPVSVAELPGMPCFVDVPARQRPEPFFKRRRTIGSHPACLRLEEGPAAVDLQQGCQSCTVCKLRWQNGMQGFCTACEEARRSHPSERCQRHPLCPRADRHPGHCKLKMKQARPVSPRVWP